ncbi:MAG: electron transfer flavoprotein subunit beta/FixA family protein [Desulfotignum sp.]|nr:electron transfer flavoprotein subunit beta/FixA family protein [Desulfotignum sp.]MCF8088648.1 electron transfer flavoprotein subunit beta/FixA family protein [Desulfotignum sp.]MCF8137852.1 electron transfer flavoprotein subunit beta/FixA family protein [Desulfotignum sp.]
MQIYVCVKHVPDSAANIHIVDNLKIEESVPFLLNPYDEHAVTEAVVLKNQVPGSEIIAVCLGKKDAESTLRSALAMGADRGLLVETEKVCDSMTTARALHAAIVKDGPADMILTGKESIDNEGMQTQFRIGALFDFPVVTNAVSLDIKNGNAIVTCELAGGRTRTFDLSLPCVIGAGRGLNTPIYPTFPDVVKSRKKPIETLTLPELNVPAAPGSAKIVSMTPLVQKRHPRKITGTPSAQAAEIIRILKQEAKVLS